MEHGSLNRDFLVDSLSEFNARMCPSLGIDRTSEKIGFYLYDQEELVGGIYGYIDYFGWLFIDLLFVNENYRKQGYGKKLLEKMESYTKDCQCLGAYLNTWEFQGKEFYLKNGYELFGTLEHCVNNFSMFFLKKHFSFSKIVEN